MRSASPFVALAATTITGFGLVAAVFLSPDFAMAAEARSAPAARSSNQAAPHGAPQQPAEPAPAMPAEPASPADRSGGAACSCPQPKEKLWHRPKFADLRFALDEADEMAALESVQLALSEVGDGSTYVWHRFHGRLSGIVQPTSSFKDASGGICRHIVVMLSSGPETKRTEGIACRLADGRWQLEG